MGGICSTLGCVENIRGRDLLPDVEVHEKIILKRILETWDIKAWTVCNWLRV